MLSSTYMTHSSPNMVHVQSLLVALQKLPMSDRKQHVLDHYLRYQLTPSQWADTFELLPYDCHCEILDHFKNLIYYKIDSVATLAYFANALCSSAQKQLPQQLFIDFIKTPHDLLELLGNGSNDLTNHLLFLLSKEQIKNILSPLDNLLLFLNGIPEANKLRWLELLVNEKFISLRSLSESDQQFNLMGMGLIKNINHYLTLLNAMPRASHANLVRLIGRSTLEYILDTPYLLFRLFREINDFETCKAIWNILSPTSFLSHLLSKNIGQDDINLYLLTNMFGKSQLDLWAHVLSKANAIDRNISISQLETCWFNAIKLEKMKPSYVINQTTFKLYPTTMYNKTLSFFGLSPNSSSSTLCRNQAMGATNNSNRYHTIAAFVNHPDNAEDAFSIALFNEFGKDFFIAAPAFPRHNQDAPVHVRGAVI